MIAYGYSGLPPTDMSDEEFVDSLGEQGFEAFEFAFTRGFPWNKPRCARFGKVASTRGLRLSIHAPYFATLTITDEERSRRCRGALEHTMKLAEAMEAPVVVAHPGGRRGEDPAVMMDVIRSNLDRLSARVDELGVGLGLETTGRVGQMGSLGDISVLSAEYHFVRPTVDWAHVHAISHGGLSTSDAFESVLAFVKERFAAWKIDPLHTHFSDVLYGDQGEIRHLPYGDGDLRITPLVEAVDRIGMRLTVISESRDADSHRRIGAEIRGVAPPATSGVAGRLAGSRAIRFPDMPRVIESRDRRGYVLSGYDHPLRLTNLDKPFFPDGYTKGDLIAYYASIAPVLLPHLEGRAIVMSRYPDGIEGSSFYEKQAPGHQPPWMPLVPLDSSHRGEAIEYVTADRPESLMWLANMGCIEVHPWLSKAARVGIQDYAVFDLDPADGAPWEKVVATALLVREALDHLGLRSYPKTSGSKGAHIYVPLAPVHEYARVRAFVRRVGEVLAAADPDYVTVDRHIPRRFGKVYIDSGQNRPGATIASVYSVRPRPGGPVSTPVRWDELEIVDPESFTMSNIWDRLSRYGDLFAPVPNGDQTLDQAEEVLGLAPGRSPY